MGSQLLALADIESNPYRRLGKGYDLVDSKVDDLMEKFGRTTFWENIVVRPHPAVPGKYQQAHGHHRVEALRRLGVESAEFIVRDFDNAQMLQSMADENSDMFDLDVASDINVLHSLLDGWCTGHLPGYEKPSKQAGRKHSHEVSDHGKKLRIDYTEKQVADFFGWPVGRRSRAAINGLERSLDGTFTIEDFDGVSARQANAMVEAVDEAERLATAAGQDPKQAKSAAADAAKKAAQDDKAGEKAVKDAARKAVAGAVVGKPAPAQIVPTELVRGIANSAMTLAKDISSLSALLEAHPEAADFVRQVSGKAYQSGYLATALQRLEQDRGYLYGIVVEGDTPGARPQALPSGQAPASTKRIDKESKA